jgi:hypothetical protein
VPPSTRDDLLARVGLQDDRDKRVEEYSKGMRGRLTLARALLHRPELLFLDEPPPDSIPCPRAGSGRSSARRGPQVPPFSHHPRHGDRR